MSVVINQGLGFVVPYVRDEDEKNWENILSLDFLLLLCQGKSKEEKTMTNILIM